MAASLFDPPEPEAPARAETAASIQARFDRWIAANPRVWDLFVRFARQARESAIRRGRNRISSSAVIERIRWEVNIETTGDEFAVSDHWTSRLSRRLIEADPSFNGWFETRRIRTE